MRQGRQTRAPRGYYLASRDRRNPPTTRPSSNSNARGARHHSGPISHAVRMDGSHRPVICTPDSSPRYPEPWSRGDESEGGGPADENGRLTNLDRRPAERCQPGAAWAGRPGPGAR